MYCLSNLLDHFLVLFFFFNDTATTEIYTLSLHDALPISANPAARSPPRGPRWPSVRICRRSEEHTSELQSLAYLVCRLLLEKKKKQGRRKAAQCQTINRLIQRKHPAAS